MSRHHPRPTGSYRAEDDRRSVAEHARRLLDEWPVECRELEVAASMAAGHVIDSGPLDGPPVLLLHAASMPATSWAPNVATRLGRASRRRSAHA